MENLPCWIWPVIAGLSGLLLGWLLRGAAINALKTRISGLEGDLSNWKTKFKGSEDAQVKLAGDLKAKDAKIADWSSKYDGVSSSLSAKETELAGIQTKLTSGNDEVSRLRANNESLSAEIERLKNQPAPQADTSAWESKVAAAEKDAADWKSKFEAADNKPAPQADTSAWESKISAAERDAADWKAKYEALASKPAPPTVAPAAAAPVAAAPTGKPDDLTKIEGIGPKIAGLMVDGGIRTFSDMANASVDRLKAILDAAGPRYQMHNPGSWPQQ